MSKYFILLLMGYFNITYLYAKNEEVFQIPPAPYDCATDDFLGAAIRRLRGNDVLLVVVPYKMITFGNKSVHFARVIQSLRGDIPIESLIRWSFTYRERSRKYSVKILDDNAFIFLSAHSKDVRRLPSEENRTFGPADVIDGIPNFEINGWPGVLPMSESSEGRCIQYLLRIQQAEIVGEDARAKFRSE